MFGNGPAAFWGRTPTTVWLGAALGTSTVASPARVAVACSRTTATTTSGFVAPGRKVLCIDYPWRMIPRLFAFALAATAFAAAQTPPPTPVHPVTDTLHRVARQGEAASRT